MVVGDDDDRSPGIGVVSELLQHDRGGMLFSKEVIETAAELIGQVKGKAVIIDPVMVGKLNSKLLKDDAIEAMKNLLIPLATVITPNIQRPHFY